MPRLEITNLTVDRGGRRVLSGLTFAVDPGTATAVVGANGTGKSTLLRAVAGLVRARLGTVRLSPADGPAAAAMHLIGHQNAIKPALSADANVRFWLATLGAGAPGGDADAAIEAALDRLGLLALIETPAELLSQGQRRRLALARLVAVPRPVWLLDEPTAGLDTASREIFARLMDEHIGGGGIILAATHEPLGVPAATLDLTAAAKQAAAETALAADGEG